MSSTACVMIFSGSSRFLRILFKLDFATRVNRSNKFIWSDVVVDDEGIKGRDTKLLCGTTVKAQAVVANIRAIVAATKRTMVIRVGGGWESFRVTAIDDNSSWVSGLIEGGKTESVVALGRRRDYYYYNSYMIDKPWRQFEKAISATFDSSVSRKRPHREKWWERWRGSSEPVEFSTKPTYETSDIHQDILWNGFL